MSRIPLLLTPALLALALAACHSEPAADEAASPAAEAETADAMATPPATDPAMAEETPIDPAMTPPADGTTPGQCNADKLQTLVGQEATEALTTQATTDSGSASVRVLKPGDAATMDFRQDRLNIETDDANKIVSLRCG